MLEFLLGDAMLTGRLVVTSPFTIFALTVRVSSNGGHY